MGFSVNLVPVPLPGTGGPFLPKRRPNPVKRGGGPYTFSMLEQLWVLHGGPKGVAPVAAAIALAESGGNPHVVNGVGATGLWQIHPGGSQYLDPNVNAAAAVAKFKGAGNKFTPWTTYTGADTPGHRKTYLDFLPGGTSTLGPPGSGIPGVDSGMNAAADAITSVPKFLAKISDPEFLKRAGFVILGFVVLIMALALFGRQYVSGQVMNVAKTMFKKK